MPEHDERGRYEEIARAALLEITTADTVGAYAALIEEGEHTYSVQFAATKPGYPGWRWTVSIAHLPDLEPSVLEAELLPDDGALLAPDWVPWADRLADWEAGQAALAADGSDDPDDDDDDFDEDDEDDDEEDDDPSDEDVLDDDEALLHSGDLDGVDIDDLDDSGDDDSEDDEEEE